MSTPRYRCPVCADPGNTAGVQCKRVWRNGDRCLGYYCVPQYLIFDLASGKYIARGKGQTSVIQEWAGVFDPEELDHVLESVYGTSDRQRVATRATIILVK